MKGKITHRIAKCRNCGWEDDCYISASKKSSAHAKKTGHTVDVETAYWNTYYGGKTT